jgi:adenylate cyclase
MIDPTVRFIANLGYVDLAWCLDDPNMAHEHANRVADLAMRQGSAYLRAYSLACSGTAHSIGGDYRAAIRAFAEALTFLRDTRVAMEIEPELLASTAECHLRSGDFDLAAKTAKEAISMSQARSARLPQCRATITLAKALNVSNDPEARDEAMKLLDQANELIRVSGATIYTRLLDEARVQCTARIGC